MTHGFFDMRRSGLAMTIAIALLVLSVSAGAQSPLTTTFAGGNGSTGNIFDLRAITPIIITDFDVNLNTGSTSTLDVYKRNMTGSYIGTGAETDVTQWTLLVSVPGVVSLGAGLPTPLNLSLNEILIPGVFQAFGIHSGQIDYTNGTAEGNLHSFNNDLEFYEGRGGTMNATTFNLTFVPRVWNGNIYYIPSSTQQVDLAMASIDAPVDSVGCDNLTATETVTATFRWLGLSPSAGSESFFADLSVDGVLVASELVTAPATPLNIGDTFQHTFGTTVDLSGSGSYVIDVSHNSFPGDGDASNDAISKTVFSGGVGLVQSFPWSENFDGSTALPMGWENDPADGSSGTNADWFLTDNASTPSIGSGPLNGDHTTGQGTFCYVEDAGNFPDVSLLSPCLDLTGSINPRLSFWLQSVNGTTGADNMFSVDVVTFPGGAISPDIFGPVGQNPTSDWTQYFVDLSQFAGQVVRLRFRGQNSATFNHDTCIDDVTVEEALPVDVGVTGISAPLINPDACTLYLGAAETVTVDMFNFGGNAISVVDLVTVNIDYDGVNVLSEAFAPLAPVPTLTAFSYTTLGTVDLSAPGNHTLSATSFILNDFNATNDTFAINYDHPNLAQTPVTFGWFETFDALPGNGNTGIDRSVPPGWNNNQSDTASLAAPLVAASDWYALFDSSGSLASAPDDHTIPGLTGQGNGNFMCIEDSGGATGQFVELITPCLDL